MADISYYYGPCAGVQYPPISILWLASANKLPMEHFTGSHKYPVRRGLQVAHRDDCGGEEGFFT